MNTDKRNQLLSFIDDESEESLNISKEEMNRTDRVVIDLFEMGWKERLLSNEISNPDQYVKSACIYRQDVEAETIDELKELVDEYFLYIQERATLLITQKESSLHTSEYEMCFAKTNTIPQLSTKNPNSMTCGAIVGIMVVCLNDDLKLKMASEFAGIDPYRHPTDHAKYISRLPI